VGATRLIGEGSDGRTGKKGERIPAPNLRSCYRRDLHREKGEVSSARKFHRRSEESRKSRKIERGKGEVTGIRKEK